MVSLKNSQLELVALTIHDQDILDSAIVGSLVLTGGDDNAVRIYSFSSGHQVGQTIPHHPALRRFAVSRKHDLVATAQLDGLIRVWKVPRSLGAREIQENREIGRVAFSKDGRRILTCGNAHRSVHAADAAVYDIESGKPAGHPIIPAGVVLDASFGVDPNEILVGRSSFKSAADRQAAQDSVDELKGTITCWNFQTGERKFPDIKLQHEPRSIAVQPGRSQFAVLTGTGEVLLFDAATGVPTKILENARRWYGAHHYCTSGLLRFNPDGSLLAIGGRQEPARIYEVASGKLLAELAHAQDTVHDVEFSPDGALIATAGHDKFARIWRICDLSNPERELAHSAWVYSVDFHSDCRHLLTGCRDGDARVFDMQTGLVAAVLQNGDANEVFDARFFNDDRWVFTATRHGTSRIWNWSSGRLMTPELREQQGEKVLYCAVSSGDERIALSGFTDKAVIFDVESFTSPSDFSAERALVVSELIAGQRLTPAGSIKLTTDEWIAGFEYYRRLLGPR